MKRKIFSIVLITVLASGAAEGGQESWAAAPESLAPLIHRYLDTEDSVEAERLLEAILSRSDASIETVSHTLEVERGFQNQPTGAVPREQINIRGRLYPLSLSIPSTYRPSKEYSLVVCLHGAGFTGEEYLERWRARLGDDFGLACPTYPSGAWFTRHAEDLVLETIRHVRRRFHVDLDRIFLTGMSNGGIGAWLIGMHHAPLFAGIAPMASGLDDALMPFLENLRNTPIYIIHGVKDQVMPVELSRSIVRELDALGYPHVYREHRREHPMAGGHYFPREELPELVAWFSEQRRNPVPSSITVVREASHFQTFAWVRIDTTDQIAAFSDDLISKHDELTKTKRYARIAVAATATNRIEVETSHVHRYTLFLNDRLVDFSKPVTVETNKQVSFRGMIVPSVETLLRQVRVRQDPRQLFPAQLSVQVPPQAP